MEKNTPKLDEIGRKHGMRVPENYFADFAEKMVEQLPEREIPVEEPPTMWMKVRPWVYMAAMFAGIWLMVKMFTSISMVSNQTAGTEMVAANSLDMPDVEEELTEEDLLNFYVDDYTAYEMLYADSDY